MKSILALSLLSVGCSPQFQVGDCVTFGAPAERWENPLNKDIEKVMEVGERRYRLVFVGNLYPSLRGQESPFNYIKSVDSIGRKVDCPVETSNEE